MATFLQILLAVFVVIVALVAGIFFWLKRRFSHAVGDYSAASTILNDLDLKPARIHLRKGDAFGYSEAFETRVGELQKLGFQRIADLEDHGGAFQTIRAAGHRDLPLAAAVAEDVSGNVRFVIFAMNRDRQVVGRGDDLLGDVVAGKVDWQSDRDASPETAFANIRPLLTGGDLRFDLKLFRAVMEQVYALRMDRSIVHEPTLETVADMAKQSGKPVTQEQVRIAYEMVHDNWKSQIEEAVLDRFRRSSRLGAVEWEELEHDIQVVHNRLTEQDVADLVAFDDVGDKLLEQFVAQGLSGVALYNAVNDRLPPDRQMKKIGEVERPVRAALYVPDEDIVADIQSARRYVYEAENTKGKAVQGSIVAKSGGDAKRQIADLGYLHPRLVIEPAAVPGTDDFDELLLDDKSAQIAARSTRESVFASIMRAIVSNWWIWAPPAGLVAKSIMDGTPYGWGDYAGFAYAALAFLALVFLIAPMFFYNQLLVAQLKARPRLAKFWIAMLALTGRFAGITANQLTIERCKALAEEDKLEDALEVMAEIRNQLTEEEYQAALAAIYSTAGEWSSMMEAQRAYLDESPAKETATVDLALSVARYSDDVEQAEPLIQSIRPSDLPEVGLIGYQYVRGLIAAHRRQHQQALKHYAQAIETARQFESLPIMVGLIAEINGYAALAYKRSGDSKRAEKLWRQNAPIIRPHRSAERLIRAFEAKSPEDK